VIESTLSFFSNLPSCKGVQPKRKKFDIKTKLNVLLSILPALSASLTFAPALRTFFNCFKSPFLAAI
jgi:hypothetical protein